MRRHADAVGDDVRLPENRNPALASAPMSMNENFSSGHAEQTNIEPRARSRVVKTM
jgi:hypothetical protein